MATSSLMSRIRQLSVRERMCLVDEIWDSIREDEVESLLSATQRVELQRRIDARNLSPAQGRPWSEVKERLRRH
jgi:putative addiction module component (TIGR02574 family)